MKRSFKQFSVIALALLLSSALAQGGHTPTNASDLQWGPAPAVFPAGAQIAVLEGDPSQAMLITLRLKLPAGYQIPAHWHPTEEDVTVLSGSLNVGMGDVLDKGASTLLAPGGFVALPPNMNHFVWTDEATVVQIHLNGPFEMTYADPAQDPRN